MLTSALRALFKHLKVATFALKLYGYNFNKCLIYIFKV